MLRGHGGEIYHLALELGVSPAEIQDHSSNVSPLSPPAGLYSLLKRHLPEIEHLPEVDSFSLRRALAARFALPADCFLPSSGTTEWIFALPRVLSPERAFILGPTYGDYADSLRQARVPFEYLLARREEGFRPPLEELDARLGAGLPLQSQQSHGGLSSARGPALADGGPSPKCLCGGRVIR